MREIFRLASAATFACFIVAAASFAQAPSLFTAEQAARGEASYDHSCLACHGPNLDDGDMGGPPLRGAYFRDHWGGGNVAALFAYAKTAMPPDDPGSLTDETYADIVAYVLERNGYRPGASALPTDPGAQEKLRLGSRGGRDESRREHRLFWNELQSLVLVAEANGGLSLSFVKPRSVN